MSKRSLARLMRSGPAGPLLLALSVGAAWLASATGHAPPAILSRLLVVLLVLALAFHGLRLSRRLLRGEVFDLSPAQGRCLLGLTLVGLVTAFVGLEHELGGRYFGDEGTFLANAQRMNEGRLLRPWFIYPHLLYTLDAIALWAASLFPDLTALLARRVWGVEGELPQAALVTRWVTATFVAATPPTVFHLGRRIAGVTAGLLGGSVAAFSTLYLSVGHQSISDVPAAYFATLCLALGAEILHRSQSGSPQARLWVAAGLAAGLAAGSKYPAGLVALALFALWLRQCRLDRRLGPGLLQAAGAAIAAFVAATPSLVAYHRQLVSPEGPDLLFGARLYAEAGWAGVIRGSNLLYYGGRLVDSFGWPVLLAGILGLALLPQPVRRRLYWLAPFPVAYAALIVVMRIAVPRNLMPILPFVAAILGCGLLGLVAALRRRGLPSLVAASALLLATSPLLVTSTAQSARFARPTTRDVAASWLEAHLPKGTLIVKEHYTPVVRYPLFARQPRFVVKLWPDELRHPRHDFVLVASEAYDRYLSPRNLHKEEFVHFARRYRELFAQLELVREWQPGTWRAGPTLKLFRVDPDPVAYLETATLAAAEARVADEVMRQANGSLRWHHDAAWAVFKAHLAAGDYRLTLEGLEEASNGRLEVVTRDGVSLGEFVVREGHSEVVGIPSDAKIFAILSLPRGATLGAVRWHRPAS